MSTALFTPVPSGAITVHTTHLTRPYTVVHAELPDGSGYVALMTGADGGLTGAIERVHGRTTRTPAIAARMAERLAARCETALAPETAA